MWASIFIFQTRVAPVRVFSIVAFLACIAAAGLAIKALVKLKAEWRWGALARAMVVSGIGVYVAYIVTIMTLARGAGGNPL